MCILRDREYNGYGVAMAPGHYQRFTAYLATKIFRN